MRKGRGEQWDEVRVLNAIPMEEEPAYMQTRDHTRAYINIHEQ